MADLSADIEEVTQWAASKKLSVDTVKTLLAYGYESMDALETLTPEDISKAKIPVGQMKLLLKAVRNTFRAEDAPSPVAAQQTPNTSAETAAANSTPNDLATAVNSETCDDAFVRVVMDQMRASQANIAKSVVPEPLRNQELPPEIQGGYSWQDPQVHLKSLSASSNSTCSNHLDIVDFVNVGGAHQSEKVMSDNSGFQIICRSGPNKPKLENLTLCQWSTANLAILHKLVEDGVLPQAQIFDYLSHTSCIYRLVSSHELVSVFMYDREYRRLQNLHKFRWGTSVSHLAEEYLRLRNHAPGIAQTGVVPHKTKDRLRGASTMASHTAQGKEICRRFNSKNGCFIKKCKFEHVCGMPGCSAPHPISGHSKNQ